MDASRITTQVDGDDLVVLFENLEFGLRPRKTFDVDDKFFDEFR